MIKRLFTIIGMYCFGVICISVGIVCGIAFCDNLLNHIYNWRLINVITFPLNILFGVHFFKIAILKSFSKEPKKIIWF